MHTNDFCVNRECIAGGWMKIGTFTYSGTTTSLTPQIIHNIFDNSDFFGRFV